MAWQTPKTDWAAPDGVRAADMNRIESNILELYNIDAVRSNLTVYVSTTGNDTTGKGTSAAPYRTITKALSTIPKNLNGNTVILNIAEGTYSEDVTISNYTAGLIVLEGPGTVAMPNLTIYNCTVKADYINLVITGGTGIFVTENGTFISAGNIRMNSPSRGLTATNCSTISLGGTLTITNTSVGITASNNSRIFAWTISGSGIGTGINAFNGGQVFYSVFNATVTTAIASTSSGGRVFTGSQSGSSNGELI